MFCLIGLVSNHFSVEVQISQWYVLFNRLIILSNQISVEIQITQWYVLLQGACVGMVAFPLQCGIDIVRVLLNYLAYTSLQLQAWFLFDCDVLGMIHVLLIYVLRERTGCVAWDNILTVAKILRKKNRFSEMKFEIQYHACIFV